MATARNLISPSLIFSNYLSPPVVVISDSKLLIGFLIGRGEVLDVEIGYQIWPPSLMALFDTYDGHFDELRAISPKEFSLSDHPDKPLCKGLSPAEKTSTEYLEKQLNLFQRCDGLIAAILSRRDYQKELKLYDKYFRSLAEEALVPYYRKLSMRSLMPT